MTRPTIDTTLMKIAFAWEERSTCSRAHVGAVIAKDGRHIGSGYNGAPAGLPHCNHSGLDDVPLPLRIREAVTTGTSGSWAVQSGCKTAIHAEANALAYCARDGISVQGATLYTTLSPCFACSQLIIAAGLARVVYVREYRDLTGPELIESAGITVDQMGIPLL